MSAATISPKRKSNPQKKEVPPAPARVVEPQPEQPQQPEVVVDDVRAFASYANFARVTGTPEEIVIDFGLNPQPLAEDVQEVKISQRLIVNFYTAKRLLAALAMTVERHESAFGPLELDVNRRVTAQ